MKLKLKDLVSLYLINKLAKKIRNDINYHIEYNLDNEDEKVLEKIIREKENLYHFKEQVLNKIKHKANKTEKHIIRKQEDYYGEYDYYFILYADCYYFNIDGKEFSFHSNIEKEYYIYENNLKGYNEIGQISSEIKKEFDDYKIYNIKIIIKYLEKKFNVKYYGDYTIANLYFKGGTLFDR